MCNIILCAIEVPDFAVVICIILPTFFMLFSPSQLRQRPLKITFTAPYSALSSTKKGRL